MGHGANGVRPEWHKLKVEIAVKSNNKNILDRIYRINRIAMAIKILL